MKQPFIVFLALIYLFGSSSCATSENNRPSSQPPLSVSTATEKPASASLIRPDVNLPTETPCTEVDELLKKMSLETQVEQLFFLRLGDKKAPFAAPGPESRQFIQENPAGGYILFAENIHTAEEAAKLIADVKEQSQIAPLIGIDEEGGTVSRLFSAGLEGFPEQPSAAALGASGDPMKAFQTGKTIGAGLSSIGIHLDFAPVADVLTNPKNPAIGTRAFGANPERVADFVVEFQRGLSENNILSAVKHFPGHGDTTGDSHDGPVQVSHDLNRLESVEFIPFKRAIDADCPVVLIGHIVAPHVDDSGHPASLSPYFLTTLLREKLYFDGLIITDALDMDAIRKNYTSGEAAVLALEAGVDMLLMPENYVEAKAAVLSAIHEGRLSSTRIADSVRRILTAKIKAGILPTDLM